MGNFGRFLADCTIQRGQNTLACERDFQKTKSTDKRKKCKNQMRKTFQKCSKVGIKVLRHNKKCKLKAIRHRNKCYAILNTSFKGREQDPKIGKCFNAIVKQYAICFKEFDEGNRPK